METPNRPILVSLGIFLGLIFFGINVSLANFSRMVSPEQPLNLLEWKVQNQALEIKLLNEEFNLALKGELPVAIDEWCADALKTGRSEATRLYENIRDGY